MKDISKVLLISANRERGPVLYPIGLGYILAGLSRKNYEAGILDFAHLDWDKAVFFRELDAYNPQYIGISIRNLDNCCYRHPRSFAGDVKQIVEWIREWNAEVTVILGGSGFSLLPDSWLTYLDLKYGIIGDGTFGFTELIENLEKGISEPDAAGLVYRNGKRIQTHLQTQGDRWREVNPARNGFIHGLPEEKIRHNILSKRGCGYQCTFCAYPALEGRKILERSSREVVLEIKEMLEVHHIREFDFVDSVFNNPRRHAEEICEGIIKKGLMVSWDCFLNPCECTEEFLLLLKRAGCRHVELGIDTASEIMLKNMKKGFTRQDIKDCIQNLKKVGLSYNVCLLFGCPGETLKTAEETLQFMDELEVPELFGLIGIRILPQTEIFKKHVKGLKESDLLLPAFYMSPEVKAEDILQVFEEKYKPKYPDWILV